ncbi:MAG TPA: ABC transporter ATP-binding protein [Nitriliruptorales bacterium]
MTRIVADHVTVAFGATRVLDRVSVHVEPGDWLALIGPNGAGKSTLLRAISGAIGHAGTIRLGDDSPGSLNHRELARRVAFVPQRPTVPVGLTVTDYVLLGRTPYVSYFGGESASDLAIVTQLLDQLDLAGLAGRDLTALSGGEFQRAVLGRALAQQAPIMLLDEPTSALDIGHAQQVLELVDRLRHEHELTIVTAMHDLTTVAQYADRLVLLAGGRSVATGTPTEVLTSEAITHHYDASVRILELSDGSVAVVPVRAQRHTPIPTEAP